jgi:cation transporter-like permease
MRAHIAPKRHFGVILAKLLHSSVISAFLGSCASFPPSSVSAGFFGANVTVATPGWSAPVPVVPYAVITKPTLLVPEQSPAANESTATVAPTANTPARTVAVVVAPVATETLAIPVK